MLSDVPYYFQFRYNDCVQLLNRKVEILAFVISPTVKEGNFPDELPGVHLIAGNHLVCKVVLDVLFVLDLLGLLYVGSLQFLDCFVVAQNEVSKNMVNDIRQRASGRRWWTIGGS